MSWTTILKRSKISLLDKKRIIELLMDGAERTAYEILQELNIHTIGNAASITRFLRDRGQKMINDTRNKYSGTLKEGGEVISNQLRPRVTWQVIQ